MELDALLHDLAERGGSDLHLRVGEPPVYRIHGFLQKTDLSPLTAEDTKRFAESLMDDARRKAFAERLCVEFSHAAPTARVRVNVFRQQGQVGAVLRLIPPTPRTLDELMLPPILRGLALQPRGLLLVAGPTGSGRSSTLAALVDYINSQKQVHIVTLEDPIEYDHTDKKAVVDQRELGRDTHSYAAALKHLVHQTPDVIMVGQLSDPETLLQALSAAETGQLVLSSVPATDAARAIDYLIEMFPQENRRQVQAQLSATLLAVVSQTLLPRADIPGRVPAVEVMVTTPSIRNAIRDGKTGQIQSDIQTGSQHGMESLDASLMKLVRNQVVRYKDALMKSPNPQEFEHRAAALNPARR